METARCLPGDVPGRTRTFQNQSVTREIKSERQSSLQENASSHLGSSRDERSVSAFLVGNIWARAGRHQRDGSVRPGLSSAFWDPDLLHIPSQRFIRTADHGDASRRNIQGKKLEAELQHSRKNQRRRESGNAGDGKQENWWEAAIPTLTTRWQKALMLLELNFWCFVGVWSCYSLWVGSGRAV